VLPVPSFAERFVDDLDLSLLAVVPLAISRRLKLVEDDFLLFDPLDFEELDLPEDFFSVIFINYFCERGG
jgi:energy-converting hydrogenase Eha subunit G